MPPLGDDLSYALRGRPSLRRRLSGLNRDTISDQLSDIDPRRFKSLYRDRAAQLAEYANAAAPIDERNDIEERLKNNNMTSSQREQLDDKLKRNPASRYGSLAYSNDPYRYGSLASQQFPSLFRR